MKNRDGRFLYHVLCPHHKEDTPSCAVYSNGTYYCFACLAHGFIDDVKDQIPEPSEELLEISRKRRWISTKTYQEISYLTGNDYFDIRDVNEQLYMALNKNLGDEREYFLKRGITNAAVNNWLLGFTGSKYTIPIYKKHKPYSIKFRRHEDYPWDMKYSMVNGTRISLFNDIMLPFSDTVILTEGELDCISLAQYGFTAVASTGGCNGVKKDWSEFKFKNKRLIIVFDNDEAGEIAAENTIKILKMGQIFNLPREYKDINEMLVGEGEMKFIRFFIKVLGNAAK